MKTVALLTLALVAFAPTIAIADDNLVKFRGGIGVHPISNVTVTPNPSNPPTVPAINVARNTVRGVDPAGQLWVIADLKAEVKTDGRIKVDGRGLLLAGGNNIGTNANASVFATLLCQVTATTFTSHSTDSDDTTAGIQGVPLEANGDFRIDDTLSPIPLACANPVLLIRSVAGAQAWFAAGIPKLD